MTANGETPMTLESARIFLDKANLSVDQSRYLHYILEYFERYVEAKTQEATLPQILSLLTGKPGTGKSYTVDCVPSLSDIMEAGFVPTASYNGMPAVLIHGSTVCSLFFIDFSTRTSSAVYNGYVRPLSVQQCAVIYAMLGGSSMSVIVVDEASSMDPTTFAIIDSRLQQIFNCTDKPFGGKSVILVGDFNQLPNPDDFLPECLLKMSQLDCSCNADGETPSVGSRSVRSTKRLTRKQESNARKYGPTSLVRRGCSLFSEFDRSHLTTQHRCKYPEHQKFINDLSDGEPITIDTIRRQYKPFTAQDVRNDPDKWQFAPVLVASNRERINITYRQCIAFAKATHTHVYRWQVHSSKWRNAPKLSSDRQEAINNDHAFWQLFVSYANAFLTGNINTFLDLANGTGILQHSLTFATPEDEQYASEQASLLPFGSIITLPNPPLSVNVAIVEPAPADLERMSNRSRCISEQRMHALRKLSLYPNDPSQPIVIPITATSKTKGKMFTIPGLRQRYASSRVFLQPLFNYDLAFSMTIHKAQGRTLERVVLALSCHPNYIQRMTFASIYVAFSRVKNPDDIRLLFHSPGGYPNYNELRYITELKPNKYTRAYYAGFVNNEGRWNQLQSLEALRRLCRSTKKQTSK